MCLILFALRAHARYPLIVAANRDESHARPTAPAGFWHDAPHVHAGRDLEQGGTWLGITRTGRFAGLTNYRQGVPRAPDKRSRGELTRGFLSGAEPPERYLHDIERRADDYNGFSVIVGDTQSLWFYSNRGAAPREIAPGVHGLSNHLLDEPWPKVRHGISALSSLLQANEAELVQGLTALLADRTPAPDHLLPATGVSLERERARSAAFIADQHYGTRASTVLLVSSDGAVLFRELRFGPGGAAFGESETRFAIERASGARARTALRA